MNISYSNPLSRGWDRMKKALFQPFDIGKWFTVGFTAFLAALVDGGSPGGNGNYSNRFKDGNFDWDEVANFPYVAWEWLNSNVFWFTLIIVGIIVLFAIIVILVWLSSRGKFMFLDNVAHDKAEVVNPWNDYSREGDSLFVWRLIFGFIIFIVFMASAAFSFIFIIDLFNSGTPLSEQVFSIFGLILQFLVLVIITAYISLFLNDFVVPIMYKNKISASEAWHQFLPILKQYPGHFILYGLFIFVLMILVVLTVILFGLFTCCVGFLFLLIPYIGSVLFLPISYTFRAFSVEFLEQFGDEFAIFPTDEVDQEALSTE